MEISNRQKGAPIPPKNTHPKNVTPKFPLAELEVGESFDVEGTERDRISLIGACRRQTLKDGKLFTTRQIEPGKWRCWRVETKARKAKQPDKEQDVPRERHSWSFRSMVVGDSFEIEGDEVDYNRLRSAAGVFTNRTGRKFRVRKIGRGKWRCTRIS